MTKNTLVVIDPQQDFCNPSGNLYVGGADEDIKRLSKMLEKNMNMFNSIHVTMDSHSIVHIAHPIWWVDQKGQHPKPFTMISMQEVLDGQWKSYHPGLKDYSIEYVTELNRNGRYVLVIWPPHCLIGHPGHNIMPELLEQLDIWESKFRIVNKLTKGSNPKTEHYSAVKADVPDPNDLSTEINIKFVQALEENDNVYISGQALSHCVANTFRDVAETFSSQDYIKKLVLITDTSSNVGGFENLGEQFIKDMTAKGMRTCLSTDL